VNERIKEWREVSGILNMMTRAALPAVCVRLSALAAGYANMIYNQFNTDTVAGYILLKQNQTKAKR